MSEEVRSADSGPTTRWSAAVEALKRKVGDDRIVTEASRVAAASTDLSCEGFVPATAVFAPRTSSEVVWVLTVASDLGLHVTARGGGMSYTRAHVPSSPGTLLLDFTEMADVVEINCRDRWAVVQPGCTWEALYRVTANEGLRVPSWGPLSGRRSTLGGAVSQNGGFFGAAASGTVLDSLLGLEVVLPGGTHVRTGAWASRGGDPSTASLGPDLTGLFVADAGAMGVKTAIALRLEPIPSNVGAASWICRTRNEAIDVMENVSRLGLAAEIYAFDPLYHELLTSLGFRDLAAATSWSVHVTVEGRSEDEIGRKLRLVDAEAADAKTKRIDSSVPLALRADPFGATQMIFSSARPGVHLPVHALVPPSRAASTGQVLDTFVAAHLGRLDQFAIRTWGLMTSMGRNLMLESSLYFPGSYRDPTDHPDTRAVAIELRRQLVGALETAGGAHFQLGKYYEVEKHMEPESWSLLEALKDAVDPSRLLNPTALGLT